VVALGEISLAGEVRKVRDLPQRIAEAARLGFRVAVVPTAAGRKGVPGRSHTVDGMTVLETPDLVGALRLLGMTDTRQPRGPAVEAVAPPREEEPREPLRSRPDDAAEPGEAPPLDPSTLEGWTMPEPLEPHDDPDEWPPLRSV
jgi:hypothetical protein